MIVNGLSLFHAQPIKDMIPEKKRLHGVSYGLAEAGYDIRIKQHIRFEPHYNGAPAVLQLLDGVVVSISEGRFTIASAIEEFQMPHDLVGQVADKSTWARQGLSVFNTVIEPGWNGFLTLELVYHGRTPLDVPAGAGIAQVLFSRLETPGVYGGKYQNQGDHPVQAIFEGVSE